MLPKRILCTVLLLCVAFQFTTSQSEDGTPEDEVRPPAKDLDEIEGSGGDIMEPLDGAADVATDAPVLENIDGTGTDIFGTGISPNACELCTCSEESAGEEFTMIVDCSNKNLTEIPELIDTRTTTLNLQNNKLEVIPKSVGELKNLRTLNLNDNLIKEFEFGSVSELSELEVLKLANNRLMELPQELKNSFGLNNLEEIDLDGNDIRETLTVDIFSQFPRIKIISMPQSTDDIRGQLCNTLSNHSLQKACRNGSCIDCPDAKDSPNGDDIGVLPGSIAADINDKSEDLDTGADTPEEINNISTSTLAPNGKINTTTEFSLRNAPSRKGIAVDTPKEDIKAEEDVKVGATSASEASSGGGVDKLVIGLIVAGMALIVTIVVIKKNWSVIKEKFGSNSHSTSDRPQPNGNTPEEVPLQEKSPV